ncbi:hypothetical protein CANCADRAFT_3763 [Tortispora caseinolytica NRRL Y-17796]|uniref:DNA damage-binding protein 1 n=1 Tax=Tortispora caseinolytica NRRL Y-17796 TaxID=767744 RepID=A0A1E4TBU3_9ASCO|nr:hypothetical protein CANCADRAFT_3763 [Tortispora caseinolytica NRRL Y-17796]
MHLYRELTKPTQVTAAVSCSLVSPKSQNLVIARSNLLQIYDVLETQISKDNDDHPLLNQDATEGEDQFIGDVIIAETQTSSSLNLIYEQTLSTSITALVAFRTIESSCDYIAISSPPSSFSVVKWNSTDRSLLTVSLHDYENYSVDPSTQTVENGALPDSLRALHSESFGQDIRLVVDPANTAIIMFFQRQMFAVLPFSKHEYDEDPPARVPIIDAPETVMPLYWPSYVKTATQLIPGLTNVIDFAFLYEYNDPTIAFLTFTEPTWTGLLPARQDTMQLYIVACDLLKGQFDLVVTIPKLPYDLEYLVPLRGPSGGVMAVGANELVYIAPTGRIIAAPVNKFSEIGTHMTMVLGKKFEHLDLFLEESKAIHLFGRNEILLFTNKGQTVVISLKLEGRLVESFSISLIDAPPVPHPRLIVPFTQRTNVFVSSYVSDSYLFGWDISLAEKQLLDSVATTVAEMDDADDDDFLYSTTTKSKVGAFQADSNSLTKLYLHDSLPNHGPILDIATGRCWVDNGAEIQTHSGTHEIVAARGQGSNCSGISIFRQHITFPQRYGFEVMGCKGIWAIPTRQFNSLVTEMENESEVIDNLMFISENDKTLVYRIEGEQFQSIDGSNEFNSDDSTVAVGTLLFNGLVVQITPIDIRIYDSELNVMQFIPLSREVIERYAKRLRTREIGEDVTLLDDSYAHPLVSAYFADPHLVLLFEDGNLVIYSASTSTCLLEKVSVPNIFSACRTVYAGILDSETTVFQPFMKDIANGIPTASEDVPMNNILSAEASSFLKQAQVATSNRRILLALDMDGMLMAVTLSDLSVLWHIPDFADLPEITVVTPGSPKRAKDARQSISFQHGLARDPIVEVCLCAIGEPGNKQDVLVARTSTDHLMLYEFFWHDEVLRIKKIPNLVFPKPLQEIEEQSFIFSFGLSRKKLYPINGMLFTRGLAPFVIVGTTHSKPHVYPVGGLNGISGVSAIRTGVDAESANIIFCDGLGSVTVCSIPSDVDLSNTWITKKVNYDDIDDIQCISYYDPGQIYIIGASRDIDYRALDDEGLAIPNSNIIPPAPKTKKSVLRLITPRLWEAHIDEYELDDGEAVTDMRVMQLDMSETDHSNLKWVLAVGTSIIRGEDLYERGYFYLFDIVGVVPEPGHPERAFKLKLLTREDVASPVSHVCDVHGYLMTVQGNRAMLRSLRDDNSVVPSAFLDLNLYTTQVKSIKDFMLFGDVLHGLYLTTFIRDPYRVVTLGKDQEKMHVAAADFVVDRAELYMIAADVKGNLHILQYDPDDVKSFSGQNLLHRSEFYSGLKVQVFERIAVAQPSNDGYLDVIPGVASLCIGGTQEGSLVSVSPISESSYRSLNYLQQQVWNRMDIVAGFNPRSYRQSKSNTRPHAIPTFPRPVIDGSVISEFMFMSRRRQMEVSRRIGGNIGDLLGDIAELFWNSDEVFDAALDLLRRVNPRNVGSNLLEVCKLAPDLAADLLASVDQPLELKKCTSSGKMFLACDYNRDGDSYRSPWSNEYQPPIAEGIKPSDAIRKLEIAANTAFGVYTDLYYERGHSSVYMWEVDDGFAGVVLFRKDGSTNSVWHSIHVFEVIPSGSSSATYRLTSTIILNLAKTTAAAGSIDLGGNLSRQFERNMSLDNSETAHVANIGRLVEESESKMRNQLQEVYFGKAQDIIGDLRSIVDLDTTKEEGTRQKTMIAGLQ